MKKLLSLLLVLLILLSASSALAAKKKSKATPTPPPAEIGTAVVDPPEAIQRLLDVAYQEFRPQL